MQCGNGRRCRGSRSRRANRLRPRSSDASRWLSFSRRPKPSCWLLADCPASYIARSRAIPIDLSGRSGDGGCGGASGRQGGRRVLPLGSLSWRWRKHLGVVGFVRRVRSAVTGRACPSYLGVGERRQRRSNGRHLVRRAIWAARCVYCRRGVLRVHRRGMPALL